MLLLSSSLCAVFLFGSMFAHDERPFFCEVDYERCISLNQTTEMCPIMCTNSYSSADVRSRFFQEFTPIALTNMFCGSVCASVGAIRIGNTKESIKNIIMAASIGATLGFVFSLSTDITMHPMQSSLQQKIGIIGSCVVAGIALSKTYA